MMFLERVRQLTDDAVGRAPPRLARSPGG